MAAIPNTEITSWLNSYLGGAAYTAPTGARTLALLTANASDTAAGTEVTGGSYARQTVTFANNLSNVRSSASTNSQSFTGMPAATVTGVNVYDSTGTPRRLAYGALSASKTVDAGDTLSFATGAVTLSFG